MTPPPAGAVSATEVFKALGDPIRWSIVQQMAAVDELACSTLEETLPISKPSISYHTKILSQAGLISTRKQGRNFFYTLRRDVLRGLIDDVWALAPEPRPVADSGRLEHKPTPIRRRRSSTTTAPARLRQAAGDEGRESEVTLLTW
ncbi:ArsR/SmtB family transcription factor [Cryptosporangium phraense]|uniref:ArsR/SmtB family transcription factor n=1 Tax=Cryptosporangium phraense TaxID=2593070 RepID=UPI00147926A3|nr:metalloregulator ArsR/SmtB family transcription factor [Cryptosporangium phraense]